MHQITYMIELLQGAQLTVAGEELPPITICIPNNGEGSTGPRAKFP